MIRNKRSLPEYQNWPDLMVQAADHVLADIRPGIDRLLSELVPSVVQGHPNDPLENNDLCDYDHD